MPSLTDTQYATLVATYGPGLSYSEMMYKYRGGVGVRSAGDLEYLAWLGNAVASVSDNKYGILAGSGSMADKQFGTSDGGIVSVITNLATNPVPASITGWSSNDASKYAHTYANNEISINRTATADATMMASILAMGNVLPANPICKLGVNYQRSIEVWTDITNATTTILVAAGFKSGTVLPANQWTTVTEQFVGSGAAAYVICVGVTSPDIGALTGIHVKVRKAFLAENPTGKVLSYADGNSYGWKWNGTVNASTSSGPAIINPAVRTNLASNPGYEAGTNSILSGSGANYVISADTVAPIAGTQSALFTRFVGLVSSTVAQILCTGTNTQFTVTAGQPVTGGLAVKTDVANAIISTRWYWYDVGNALTVGAATTKVAAAAANQVYRVVDTAVPPVGTVKAYFVVTVNTSGANCVGGERVWADQLTLENGITDGSFF